MTQTSTNQHTYLAVLPIEIFEGCYGTDYDLNEWDDDILFDFDYLQSKFSADEIEQKIDCFWKNRESREWNNVLGKNFVHALSAELADLFHLNKDPLEFDKIVSPQFYNFETDRITVKIGEDLKNICTLALDSPLVKQAIIHDFSDRPGFISFYPVIWDASDLDQVQLGYLLAQAIKLSDLDYDVLEKIKENVFEYLRSNTDTFSLWIDG